MESCFDHYNPDPIGDLKSKVTKAFRALRKRGIVARRNFKCCGSCASAAIQCEIEAMPKPDRPIGAVYWHRQAEAGFRDRGVVYINFGSAKDGEDAYGKETEEIGSMLVDALKAEGVLVDWDGSPWTAVMICAEGASERVRAPR